MNYKKTILIDFDGVLNDYDGNYDHNRLHPMKKGAYEFLEKLSKIYKVKIFSSRDLKMIHKWLLENNLSQFISGVTNIKEPAFLLIDDRCFRFKGDFEKTFAEIEKFSPYWKK